MAALLPDGNVLAAAGVFGTPLRSAELYDPITGTWTLTGKLNQGRIQSTATLLNSGAVLVAAGDATGGRTNTAELYGTANTVTTVDGHGSINGQGGPAKVHFHITQSGTGAPFGTFIFSDPSAGISKLKGKVTSMTVTGNSADFSGNGVLEDGSRVNFEVIATDNGAGTSDTCSVSLNNGYTASGNLIRGDIRVLTR